MNKRLLFVFCALLLLAVPDGSAKNRKNRRMPSQETIDRIHDSILSEGMHLYYHERIAWISTDQLGEFNPEYNDVGGYFTTESNDTLHTVYFSLDRSRCVFEYWMCSSTFQTDYDTTSRPLSLLEQAEAERTQLLQSLTFDAVKDSLSGFPQSDFGCNLDFIRIDEEITRSYFTMSAKNQGVVPFGNDFSCDFDNNNHLVAMHRYHRSFIPLNWNKEDAAPKSLYLSHTPDNPYMTPTEVCLFLLYAQPAGVESLFVLSTALDSVIIFHPGQGIVTIKRSVLEKIGKDQEKRHGKKK